MRTMITFAPSGAGKTHYSKTSPGLIMDGDDVITSTIGWPTERHWWRGPNAKDFHRKSIAAIIKSALTGKFEEIVFNMNPEIALEEITRAEIPFRIVLPPRAEMVAHAKARATEYAKTGDKGQPTDPAEMMRNWESWAAQARIYGISPASSFK